MVKKQNKLRIVFYYIRRNLGHSRTIFSLVKALREIYKEKATIVVLQSGTGDSVFPFEQYCDFHVLPYSEISETKEKSNTQFAGKAQKRILFISKLMLKIKPDFFITELYPLGQDFWSFEVPIILKFARKKLDCKIIASFSYLMWPKDAFAILDKFYDQIIFHFPKKYLVNYLLSPAASLQGKRGIKKIFKHLKKKIYFTGYLLDTNFDTKTIKSKAQDSKTILVSRGGGKGAKNDIIINSILAAKNFEDNDFCIIAGPDTPNDKFKMYQKIAKKFSNIRLLKKHNNFRECLANCRLSINMAGYNTIAEILWLGKQSIIIPYGIEEQLVRADFLKKTYKLAVLLAPDFSVEKLIKQIKNILTSNKARTRNVRDFQGIEQTIKLLKKLQRNKS